MKPSQRDPKPLSCLLLGRGTDPGSEAHGATPSILPLTPGASPLGSPWPSPPAGRSGSALPTAESHQTLLCCGRSACRVLCLCASLCVYCFFIFFLEDFGMNPAGILTFPQRFPHLEAFFILFFSLSPRAALALQTAPAAWEAAWSRSQRRIFGGLLFSSGSYTTAEEACRVSTTPRQRRACWFGHACDSVDAPGGAGSKQDPPGDFG